MLNIKVTDLSTSHQIEEQELTVLELMKINGGIRIQLLGNNFIDATFGGLRLTL
ncbi:hypothetical protein I8751_06920 [Nostocaceae cyanobacterium CENA357]|uniref:Uncharacterized protein n=1 Tax=Atlanticothrix silvestris CENA357 TaxID=1725252 RepID=A0A8J7HFK8_9CYAN|nr:hypothetical protein [Atlanticothrix silvestris]MBH8552105.1 hypothetical protein [Atlanticothrix silvestris CENA357]